jgi:hypothetical protein
MWMHNSILKIVIWQLHRRQIFHKPTTMEMIISEWLWLRSKQTKVEKERSERNKIIHFQLTNDLRVFIIMRE